MTKFKKIILLEKNEKFIYPLFNTILMAKLVGNKERLYGSRGEVLLSAIMTKGAMAV